VRAECFDEHSSVGKEGVSTAPAQILAQPPLWLLLKPQEIGLRFIPNIKAEKAGISGGCLDERNRGKSLKTEGKSALDRAVRLGKIQCASIRGEEWAISLFQEIAHGNQGFGTVGKQMSAVYGLMDQQA
jgi:hypothetical protein